MPIAPQTHGTDSSSYRDLLLRSQLHGTPTTPVPWPGSLAGPRSLSGGLESPQSRLRHATWIKNQPHDPEAMSLAPPDLSGLLLTIRMTVPASQGHQPSPGLQVPGLVDAWSPTRAQEEEVSLSRHKRPQLPECMRRAGKLLLNTTYFGKPFQRIPNLAFALSPPIWGLPTAFSDNSKA